MTHKVLDITTYKFTAKDRLFLDTNIWLYNYCESCSVSPSYRPEVDSYSQALQDIHEKKSRIHIDVLVVSEFINRYARLKWKQEALNMDIQGVSQQQAFQADRCRNRPYGQANHERSEQDRKSLQQGKNR